MAFPSDGRNHRDSIKVEKSMYKYKDVFENYYKKEVLNIVHVGGTKELVDFRIEFLDGTNVTKSLKKKKTIGNGSFDYINTSDFDQNILNKSKIVYNQIKNNTKNVTRDELKEAISYDLCNIDFELLTNFVINKVINKYKKIGGLDIVETSTNAIFINVQPGFFTILENGGFLKINNNGKIKESYKLDLFDKDGILQDECGLRVRLHLNNGWTKLKKGGTSVLVLKIQQDKVKKILNYEV